MTSRETPLRRTSIFRPDSAALCRFIHFAPAADVDGGFRTLPDSIESRLSPYIRGGRAIFSVVLEGYVGRPRPPGFEQPDSRSEEFVDYVVRRVTELRRGLDYIETRPDLDH